MVNQFTTSDLVAADVRSRLTRSIISANPPYNIGGYCLLWHAGEQSQPAGKWIDCSGTTKDMPIL
jgi:hypothetical protein